MLLERKSGARSQGSTELLLQKSYRRTTGIGTSNEKPMQYLEPLIHNCIDWGCVLMSDRVKIGPLCLLARSKIIHKGRHKLGI